MSQSGIYSELKPAWHYAREGKLPDAPKQVQLVLADLCNQSCGFCAYRMDGYTSNELFMGDSKPAAYGHNNPNRVMDPERALSLLDEFKEIGVLAVQFTGGGEPTVNKDHEVIFQKCLDLGMKASLVSNGLKWSKHLRTEILPQFSWVRVSIDAGYAATYAAVRRTPIMNWDHVWNHVVDLADAIADEKSQTVLGLGFVVTPDNWEEIVSFARIAKTTGARNIRFSAMFSPKDEKPFADIYKEIAALIKGVRKLESKNFTIHDNFGSRFEDLKQHAPDYSFCSYQFYTAYVGGDLNPYRCCVLSYNERGKIAGVNLADTSFATFWKSQARKDDMQALDARGCERCQFNSKNRAVNYLMDDDVPHKEFP